MPRIELQTEIKANRNVVFDLSRSIDLHKISTEQTNEQAMYQSLIIFFPKLCFLIIGRIPQNGIKRKKDNRSTWNLSEFG